MSEFTIWINGITQTNSYSSTTVTGTFMANEYPPIGALNQPLVLSKSSAKTILEITSNIGAALVSENSNIRAIAKILLEWKEND